MAFLNWVAKLFVISCLILGVAFNAITLRGCNILSVKHNDVTVGIFGLEVRGGGCIPYPEDQTTDVAVLLQASENPYMRTAQAGSIAGLSFGVLAFVFLVMDQFLCRVPGARCLTSMCFMGAQVGTALVYFIYLGEYCDGGRGCKWETGATFNLIALLAYIFGAFFLGCMGSKPRERWEQDRPVRDIEEGPRNDPKHYRW